MKPTSVRCRAVRFLLLLAFGGLLCATRTFALPAPDSASLARLQIQIGQYSRVRILTAHDARQIRKPFVDETGFGSRAPARRTESTAQVQIPWSDVLEVQVPHNQALLYGVFGSFLGLIGSAYVFNMDGGSGEVGAANIVVGTAVLAAGVLGGTIYGSVSPRWETINPENRIPAKKSFRSRLER